VSDALARICTDKRAHIDRRRAAPGAARIRAEAAAAPPPRGFARRLAEARAAGRPGLIAEIKRASPSRGLIRADFDPAALARAYEAGGATCISVLTDTPWFQGEDAHLTAARGAVALPVLRKDFIIDPWQVQESRALGADCILVIMAAVDDALARRLAADARALGMDVLVEVHDRAELDRALGLDAPLIGINNRNLKTLAVDLATAEALAPLVPKGRIVVAESGLASPRDLARMTAVGVTTFLVGESLMRAGDVEAAVRALLAPAGAPA
jgi:indole-3-glycerol phosphate synthase